MATIVTKPSLVIPQVQTKVQFTPTIGPFLRVWVTDAPPGSELKKKLDSSPQSRVLISDLKQVSNTFQWTYTFDQGGKYLLSVQEYRKGSNFGGGFDDDPDASPKEEVVGVEDASLSIVVCKRVTQRIGAAGDTVTLVVYVDGTTIVSTTKAAHGEKTPVLIEPSSARANTAATAYATQVAMAALVDVVASTALGDSKMVFNDIMLNFNQHLVESGVHYTDDINHAVSDSFSNPDSPKALEQAVSELAHKMRLHFENQDADNYGVGSDSYHNAADWLNIVTALPTGDTAGAMSALANLHLSFEAHRSFDGHQASDSVNALGELPVLIELHSTFINELRQTSPEVPSVMLEAAVVLVHGAGFEEKEI